MDKLFFSFLILLLTQNSLAAIQSGRPGQSIGAGVVGKGMFQIQSGVESAQQESVTKTDTFHFNNVIRYGLTKDFEVSTLLNYASQETKVANTSQQIDGLNEFHLGFRSHIVDADGGFIPNLAIQTRFRLRAVDSDFPKSNTAPIVVLSAVFPLSTRTSFTTNWGASYSGNSTIPTYFWTTNFAFSLTPQWGIFVEPYGSITDDKGEQRINAGGEYFVNDDTKIDFSTGWGNNNGVSDNFVSLGISWRIQTLD